jgi:hypothetical protein
MGKIPIPVIVVAGVLAFGCVTIPATMMARKAVAPKYAEKLKLPTLPVVRALAPADTPITNSRATGFDSTKAEAVIRGALTPSQADTAVSTLRMANSFGGMIGNMEPNRAPVHEERKLCLAYLEQAAQIKRAQLENGDSSDSTGEVEERLKAAHQASVNMDTIEKTLPPSSR